MPMFYLILCLTSFIILILLAHKWELDWKIVIPWSVLMGMLACVTLFIINDRMGMLNEVIQLMIGISQTIFLSAIAVFIMFFRDPERISPAKEGVVISPADGIVKYVKIIDANEFPFAVKGRKTIPLTEFTEGKIITDGGIQIGIVLSFLNVHVNRSPVAGKISFLKIIPGRFKSLKNIGSLLENERAVMVIDGEKIKLGLVLIASRLVRRIVMYLKENDHADIGQRLGMIRFGSQADILLPNTDLFCVKAKPGMKVKAGISVLATYDESV